MEALRMQTITPRSGPFACHAVSVLFIAVFVEDYRSSMGTAPVATENPHDIEMLLFLLDYCITLVFS